MYPFNTEYHGMEFVTHYVVLCSNNSLRVVIFFSLAFNLSHATTQWHTMTRHVFFFTDSITNLQEVVEIDLETEEVLSSESDSALSDEGQNVFWKHNIIFSPQNFHSNHIIPLYYRRFCSFNQLYNFFLQLNLTLCLNFLRISSSLTSTTQTISIFFFTDSESQPISEFVFLLNVCFYFKPNLVFIDIDKGNQHNAIITKFSLQAHNTVVQLRVCSFN